MTGYNPAPQTQAQPDLSAIGAAIATNNIQKEGLPFGISKLGHSQQSYDRNNSASEVAQLEIKANGAQSHFMRMYMSQGEDKALAAIGRLKESVVEKHPMYNTGNRATDKAANDLMESLSEVEQKIGYSSGMQINGASESVVANITYNNRADSSKEVERLNGIADSKNQLQTLYSMEGADTVQEVISAHKQDIMQNHPMYSEGSRDTDVAAREAMEVIQSLEQQIIMAESSSFQQAA